MTFGFPESRFAHLQNRGDAEQHTIATTMKSCDDCNRSSTVTGKCKKTPCSGNSTQAHLPCVKCVMCTVRAAGLQRGAALNEICIKSRRRKVGILSRGDRGGKQHCMNKK